MQIIDLTGKRFGRLTVIKRGENVVNRPGWICKCDCGKTILVAGGHLRDGHTQSCGCRQRDSVIKKNTVHSMSNTRLYNTWNNMKDRCFNPNSTFYSDYGGRGIKVCDEWMYVFQTFYDWAISHGYHEGLTIERVDVNGDYCPENCTWIPFELQARNKRNTLYVDFNGRKVTLMELSEISGMKYSFLYERIIRKHIPADDVVPH